MQDFNGLDGIDRNGVQVDSTRNTRSGGTLNPAPAIDQHQNTLGPEVAQINLRRTGADAAAIWREAQVSGGVVGAVDG